MNNKSLFIWVIILFLISIISCNGRWPTRPFLVSNTLYGTNIIIDSAGFYRCVNGDHIEGRADDYKSGGSTFADSCELQITFQSFFNTESAPVFQDGDEIRIWVNAMPTNYVHTFNVNKRKFNIDNDTLKLLLY